MRHRITVRVSKKLHTIYKRFLNRKHEKTKAPQGAFFFLCIIILHEPARLSDVASHVARRKGNLPSRGNNPHAKNYAATASTGEDSSLPPLPA